LSGFLPVCLQDILHGRKSEVREGERISSFPGMTALYPVQGVFLAEKEKSISERYESNDT